MQTAAFIYALHDPACLGGCIRYIGKAEDVARRFAAHLSSSRKGEKSHKANWLRSLFSRGLGPQVVTIEAVPPGRDWQKIERDYIRAHRAAGAELTNICDGGEGASEGNTNCKGYVHTPETRASMSAAHLGNTIRRGKKMPESAKAKISAALMGNYHLKGHKHTEETKAKISAGVVGLKRSVETRARMSLAAKKRRAAGNP